MKTTEDLPPSSLHHKLLFHQQVTALIAAPASGILVLESALDKGIQLFAYATHLAYIPVKYRGDFTENIHYG